MKDLLNERTAALYIRVSTGKQEELSPESQIKLGLEYAKQHNMYVPPEYIFRDDGISGRKADKRPQFINMIALAKDKKHPIDVILVWKFSRFARNQEESIVYKSLLSKNNVDVISVSEPLIEGPFGNLIERIIEWMDEYYSIRLSGEVTRGMTANAQRGKYQSDAPIGYTSPGYGELPVINPETVKIPLMIKDLFLSGQNILQITKQINAMGYRTKRGNLFDTRGIRYILENPFYYGKSRWNYSNRGRKLKSSAEVIYADGAWEPLWNEDIYNQIQQKLAVLDKRSNTDGTPFKKRSLTSSGHWLAGMLKCSSCGSSLVYGVKGFQCHSYSKGMCTVSHFVSEHILCDLIITALHNFLLADGLDYRIESFHDNNITSATIISELELKAKRIELKEQRIKEAYRDGIDTLEEYKENKQILAREREDIEKQLFELSAQNAPDQFIKEEYDNRMVSNISDVISIITDESADNITKGNAIRSIADKIVFDRKNCQVDIYLKLM